MKTIANNWDNMRSSEKMLFGSWFITHESDLSAWAKNFNSLSSLKKRRVIDNLPNSIFLNKKYSELVKKIC